MLGRTFGSVLSFILGDTMRVIVLKTESMENGFTRYVDDKRFDSLHAAIAYVSGEVEWDWFLELISYGDFPHEFHYNCRRGFQTVDIKEATHPLLYQILVLA